MNDIPNVALLEAAVKDLILSIERRRKEKKDAA